MAKLIEDTSGRIEYGLFFSLEAYMVMPWSDYSHALISPPLDDHPLNAVAIASVKEEFATGRCARHPDEQDILRIHEVEVQLFGGASDGQFLGGLGGGYLYVSQYVAEMVLQAGFRGARFGKVRVNYNSSRVDGELLRVMCFDGCSAYRPEVVVPPEANCCHVCGFTPIVCSVCGHLNRSCPVCEASLLSYGVPDNDVRVNVVPEWKDGRVISLDRWDGSDFLCGGGGIVTGRVVDLLFSLNPKVLCAQALRCFVGDHSESEFEHLRSRRFRNRKGDTLL